MINKLKQVWKINALTEYQFAMIRKSRLLPTLLKCFVFKHTFFFTIRLLKDNYNLTDLTCSMWLGVKRTFQDVNNSSMQKIGKEKKN